MKAITRRKEKKMKYIKNQNVYSTATVPKMAGLPHLSFFQPLLFICTLNISIYRLNNDVGQKIEVDDVGFFVGPNCHFYHDIVILCRDIVVFVFCRRLCCGFASWLVSQHFIFLIYVAT